MNPALLAAELAAVDGEILVTLARLERILQSGRVPDQVAIAIVHAQETLALLSRGFESLADQVRLTGPENPSFN